MGYSGTSNAVDKSPCTPVRITKGDELTNLSDRITSLSIDTARLVRERFDKLITPIPEVGEKYPEEIMEIWPTYLNELRGNLIAIERSLNNILNTVKSVEV